MILGASQINITPKPGVELSGFAARIQPSTGVLDPLFAKALYLEGQGTRLLWIHCDLIGFDRLIVESFRAWAAEELGLRGEQVLLSATHTHAGPCTIHLREAGEYDAAFVETLLGHLREVSVRAMASHENVELVALENHLNLAVDRRKPFMQLDSRVAGIGFRRQDGTFVSAIINYPVHPVALGPRNRLISADISGQAALSLSRQLPGAPIVFMTNGASGNLNPPAENVSFEQVRTWGETIAASVAQLARTGGIVEPEFRVARRMVPLPLDALSEDEVNRSADKALTNEDPLAQWGDKYRRVVEHWRSNLLSGFKVGANWTHRDAELFAVQLGAFRLLGVNAEVFSEFTDWLRKATGKQVFLLGYANGDMGYLPTGAAYSEGGYEVEVAHFFYGGFRPQAGSLELLSDAAISLLRSF